MDKQTEIKLISPNPGPFSKEQDADWEKPSYNQVKQIQSTLTGKKIITATFPLPALPQGIFGEGEVDESDFPDVENSDKKKRKIAEELAARDLLKPYEQLLSDVIEESNEDNQAGLHKRTASLIARSAISNEEASRMLLSTSNKLLQTSALLEKYIKSIGEVVERTDVATQRIKDLTYILIVITILTTLKDVFYCKGWPLFWTTLLICAVWLIGKWAWPKKSSNITSKNDS